MNLKNIFHNMYAHTVLMMALFLLVQLTGSEQNRAYAATGLSLPEDAFAGDYLSARFARHQYDDDAAVRYFSSALAKDPDNPALLEKGYELMLSSGEMQKALQLAKRYVKQNDSLSRAHIIIALNDIRQENFAGARALLSHYYLPDSEQEKNEIDGVLLPMMLFWVTVAQGDFPAAEEILHNVSENQQLPFLKYQQAVVSDLQGRTQEAKEAYEYLLKSEQPYRIVKSAAQFFYRTGDEARARKLLASYAETNGSLAFDTERVLAASAIQDVARRSVINLAEVFMEVGGFMLANGAYDHAVSYLRMALMLEPGMDYAHVLLANVYEKQQQYALANASYANVPGASPFSWSARASVALNLSRMGEKRRAEKMLLLMTEEQPERYDTLLDLADILMGEKAYDRAINYYNQALERIEKTDESHWSIFYARGIAYEQSGQWDNAEADFLEAIKLKPGQPDVLNYLGYSWLIKEKDLPKAEKMLLTAIKSRPRDAHIIDSYGWALFKLGKYEKSVQFLERANLLMPYDPTINDHLGDAYWRVGRHTEAHFQWNRALSFTPAKEEVSRIESKLKDGLPDITLSGAMKNEVSQLIESGEMEAF